MHYRLPSAFGNFGVGRGQVCPGDLEVEIRLPMRFVLRMEKRQGFALVFGAQAVLFACRRVLGIINYAPSKQDEPWFHTLVLNDEPVRKTRVSVFSASFSELSQDSGELFLRSPLY